MFKQRPRTLLSRCVLTLGLALASVAAWSETATESDLARRLDQLAAELASVKAQLVQLQQQKAQATTPVPAPATPTVAVSAPEPSAAPATVPTSYAEINFNRSQHASQASQADIRRFVLGYQRRVDDRTKIVTELEVEHAVASASDPGEVEVEQAYVERQLDATWALRAGLFLMPVGLLNENHEPTAFYGVERNFVETAIIPSTWREGGVQLVGNFDNGLSFQAGLSTGFDINKWDAASAEGQQSPLGSIHQEMALARSRDLAVFAALNWRGVPGLLLGGSVFTGTAGQGLALASPRITLWDLHARWTPGRWDFSALATRGTLSNTAALNAPLVGHPSLIPQSFDGYYVQGAYRLWSRDERSLSPFARWERTHTAAAYADLGPGMTPPAGKEQTVLTLGANFVVAPGIVVKADVQRFREDSELNRVNLGLGWSF